MTHHQDISFLKSKSVAHCKIHVFIVSNGGRLCLLQPKSGDHCDWGRRGTLSPHLDTALGLHPLLSTNQSPVSGAVDQLEAGGWPPISSSLSSDNGALCHTLDIGQSLIITRPSSDIR